MAFLFERSCFFGCPLEQPLLPGAREVLGVDGPGDDRGVTAVSLSQDVVEVATERSCRCEREGLGSLDAAEGARCPGTWTLRCDNRFPVRAVAPGDADLELRDPQGKLVDRVAARVRQAATSRLVATLPDRLGEFPVEGSLELTAGQRARVDLEVFDGDGLALLAPEGIPWSVGDASVARVEAFTFGAGAAVTAGKQVDVVAVAAGATELRVLPPGAPSTASVLVAAP